MGEDGTKICRNEAQAMRDAFASAAEAATALLRAARFDGALKARRHLSASEGRRGNVLS
jgi:hypothetical protein